ncbi:hypothetical protein ACFRCG_48605, partial [Embleya sp. NPDC056575]|uniref:hypothetical protein n=1 Tax=Embleya sp. NPDC056575 TaxID=3345869 RepID=UPI003693D3B5
MRCEARACGNGVPLLLVVLLGVVCSGLLLDGQRGWWPWLTGCCSWSWWWLSECSTVVSGVQRSICLG